MIKLLQAIIEFLSRLIGIEQENSWSSEAQIRKLRLEIARLEDEKRLWQNKRLAYVRNLEPVPEQLQNRITEIVRAISANNRQLESLKTK